jgi:hypothetical protein
MDYIKTFESYLEGGRAPLYHFTRGLIPILESDKLKPGMSVEDNFGSSLRGVGFKKSISFTRMSSLSSYGEIRIKFDVNKLKQNYKIYQLDEIGAKSTKLKKYKPWISKHRKYTKLDIHHNLSSIADNDELGKWEVEFEERIYKEIENVGKYITHIDLSVSMFEEYERELKEYIEKYPHIVVRELKMVERYVGKEKKQVPKEDDNKLNVLLDINILKKQQQKDRKKVKVV